MRHFLVILIAILIVSCKKQEKPNYPDEPQINITDITFEQTVDFFNNDLIRIRLDLNITDGNSNFGLTEIFPMGEDSVNCNLIIYHKTDGKLIEIVNFLYYIKDCDILGCSGYDFPITTKSYNAYEINTTLYFESHKQKWPYENEELKFTVQIWDRDENMSNIAEIEALCRLK